MSAFCSVGIYSQAQQVGQRDAPPVGGFGVLVFIKVRWLRLVFVIGAPLNLTLDVLGGFKMKFYQWFFLPFIPNIFKYVELTDKEVSYVSFWHRHFSLPISGITPHTQISSLGHVFGWGSITFNFQGSSYDVPNLVEVAALKRVIESRQKAIEEKQNEQQKKKSRSMPNNIRFSDHVLILPCILDYFGRPLWEANPTSSFQTRPWKYWDWINQGEVLGEFNIKVGSWHSQKHIVIPILSPVSGLLLDPQIGFHSPGYESEFFSYPPQYTLMTRILLPENERVPTDASMMYQEFCTVCKNHPEIFFKPGKLTNQHAEQRLADAISRQEKPPIRVLSMTKDFPDHLEEVKHLYPNFEFQMSE